jgi:drug/metabolite transporter (DMT)-like permease
MFWRYGLLCCGVFACSTAVIQIKASHTHPLVLAALRLAITVVLRAPVFASELRRHPDGFTRAHLRRTHLPAIVLATHFISWTYGARMTFAAQAALIVNLAPIAIPFFLHALVGERITAREILGTVIAVGGVLLLTAHDAFSGSGDTAGNLVCLGSMLLFAWYLALGRKNRDFASIWLYVVPVYLQAGLICLVVAAPLLPTFAVGSAREWSLMVGLAVGPTLIGHSLINLSMRHFRGQVVSVANVGQFVFAGAMAFWFFGEQPAALFYAASAMVVAGIALVVFASPTAPPRLR